MNLYIKNLEPHITNSDLTQLFRKFGRIISARVMTNPQTGQSKGYGFVSFGKTEEAAAALHEMDGVMLGNRPLVVAYHEPRKPRPTTNNTNNTTTTTNYQDSYYHQRQMPPATAINGLGIDNVEELGMNLKDLSIGHKPSMTTINLPPRKDPVMTTTTTTGNGGGMMKLSSSPMSGTTSTGRSLASLASGMSVSAPPPHPYPQQQQHHHVYTPPQPPPVVNLGHNGKPSLRRRGSLESVMTESSATIQRTKLHDAVRTCGDYGKATEDIVDMLLTLKRKERSLCLFNPDFLKDKVNLALEALATCNESESDDEDEDDEDDDDVDGLDMEYTMRNRMAAAANMKKPLSPPLSQPVYSTPTTPTNMKRESKAIPIVAPPTPKKSSLPVEQQQQQPVKNKDVEALLLSFEGKPVHEKKQLLGDKLFPLVKSTGTRQAPKVTIYLLDTVDLHDLAKIMFDTQLLKMRVEEAFLSLQQ
ncbi:uncharacterized protein EV154DRAFT_284373 [Mucor mucedo]|uniref:uncharacterized protein n=1 Tax=Mucor mucedo TaxID=29922 RepID=UPI00221E55C1|nr:uncharacterized protein EV154DRAFT_284373 [Mucor mucedo]KAI7889347.1 hypothetical protein EV154DRAFT_284373 [Mucor mucedo]